MCGEVKSKEKEKTSSMPLVTVSDLQRLPQWTMIVLRLRMMPFKTKMKPNWQMEKENLWGIKYPKATYPSRKKHKIELCDIKGYVQKKKEEKINEMMNGTGGGMPFMPPGGPGFVPPMFNKKPEPDKSFNVDDLVKRIDAKIAELEAEEEKEKQEQLKQKEQKEIKEQETKEDKQPEKQEKRINDLDIPKDIIDDFDLKSVHKPDEKLQKSGITDDQFFDDFFNDDE